MPSAGEFLHEFVGHFVALEGKLWKTLKLLVLRPGQLTVDFLAGRRVPFIAPLRLYLTLSLVFFALVKIFSIELPHITINASSIGAAYDHSVPSESHPGKFATGTVVVNLHEAPDEDKNIGAAPALRTVDDQIHDAIAMVGRVDTRWMKNLTEFTKETDEKKAEALNHGFLAFLPYMLIGALPLFALYLKLVYHRSARCYGEHLVFALHSNSFAFLMASLMIVMPGSVAWVSMAPFVGQSATISIWDWLQVVPFLCLVAYLPIAMRRVYGGSRFATGCRWLLLMTAHLLVVAISTSIAELTGIMSWA